MYEVDRSTALEIAVKWRSPNGNVFQTYGGVISESVMLVPCINCAEAHWVSGRAVFRKKHTTLIIFED